MIQAPDLLHPLPALYSAAGRELPEFASIEPGELSDTARRLLVHSGDMTSKLEEQFGDEMLLRVIQCEHTAEHYRREVVLCCAKSGMAVEYGAIEINLSAFDPALRDEIVEAKLPLGGLLNRHGIRYRSEPRGFLRVAPCKLLGEVFDLAELPISASLYGRSNRLLSEDGTVLAQIVEVLRPV